MAEKLFHGKRKRSQHPDPIDVHVGSRLRLRRGLAGLSQEQLGKASGLTFQQIQKYERGTNRMGASRLFQLARILGVNVEYFFENPPAEAVLPSPGSGVAEGGQSPLEGVPKGETELLHRRETMELIRAYYRITDQKQRRKVYELIRSMSEQPE